MSKPVERKWVQKVKPVGLLRKSWGRMAVGFSGGNDDQILDQFAWLKILGDVVWSIFTPIRIFRADLLTSLFEPICATSLQIDPPCSIKDS